MSFDDPDPDFDELFERLRHSIVHSTSLPAFASIVRDGMIKPTGTVEPAWPNYAKTMYSGHIGAVAVFDFGSCRAERARAERWKFEPVLVNRRPLTVLLELDRSMTPLKANSEGTRARDAAVPGTVQLIPHVEAWHVGPVSLTAVNGVVVVRRDPLMFAEVALEDLASQPWERVAESCWPGVPLPLTDDEAAAAGERRFEGTVLGELIKASRAKTKSDRLA